MSQQAHWENIYKSRDTNEVSWYQANPAQSLKLIQATGIDKDAALLDAGGGASRLVDRLLEEGYHNLSVLDIASSALEKARARLGWKAGLVQWLRGDVIEFSFLPNSFDLWHDRAVFHFLTQPEERNAYKRNLLKALKPEGHLVIATFALDGPPKCSNLEVMRYSPESLAQELGSHFQLLEIAQENHATPFETFQRFIYCRFRHAAT